MSDPELHHIKSSVWKKPIQCTCGQNFDTKLAWALHSAYNLREALKASRRENDKANQTIGEICQEQQAVQNRDDAYPEPTYSFLPFSTHFDARCDRCGVPVTDRKAHTRWHAELS